MVVPGPGPTQRNMRVTLCLVFFVLLSIVSCFTSRKLIKALFHRPDQYEDPSPNGYDAKSALEQRRRVLDQTCNRYSDVFGMEQTVANVSGIFKLEKKRKFLLNREMTFCISDFEQSDVVSELFDHIVNASSDWDLDLKDPCKAKETLEKNKPKKYEPIEHPDYPGVYYHPSRRKFECNLRDELEKLKVKVVAVQHPMERIVNAFKRIERPKTFVEFVDLLTEGHLYPISSSEQINDSWQPYWSQCQVCDPAVRPNWIIKQEFLDDDVKEFMQTVFAELVENFPFSAVSGLSRKIVPSEEAVRLFRTVSRSKIVSLFEIYRADHELYSYDPRPYIQLGIDKL